MSRLYHYTVGIRLESILQDLEIRPATAHVDASSERPVVWCTFSREWEPTCNKLWQDKETGGLRHLSAEETAQLGGGLFRIEVQEGAAPHDWEAFRLLSGCPAGIARALHIAAVEAGSDPALWRVSFEPIPLDRWVAVEGHRDGDWVNLDDL